MSSTRLEKALRAAGVPVVGVSPRPEGGYRVFPEELQAAAQPIIDAFNPNDPAHAAAELDAQVKAALDNERLTSAVVWTILKQMYPADTDVQLKTKFGVARTRIISAYQAQPWK